jgi:hypothetical protein
MTFPEQNPGNQNWTIQKTMVTIHRTITNKAKQKQNRKQKTGFESSYRVIHSQVWQKYCR